MDSIVTNIDTEAKYILGVVKWFYMPTTDGRLLRAVAVKSSDASMWIAAYTLLLILIFVGIARLVKDLVVTFFPLRGNGNRYAMLVGYYNTNDPVTIILLAVAYCYKTCVFVVGDGRGRIDWNTFWLGIGLISLSLALLGANAIGGVLVPGNLRLGHVARVNPEKIFSPRVDANATTLYEYWQRFQSPTAFRAVSDLVQMKVTLKNRYVMNFTPIDPNGPEPGLRLDYSYVVTGVDFGFQRAPGLKYTASGICNTRYDWYDASSTEAEEVYFPVDSDGVPLNPEGFFVKNQTTVPTVEFYAPPTNSSIRSFLMIPHTANRESETRNLIDPWYLARDVAFPDQGRIRYRVAPRRPVVYCEQVDTYEFEGKKVDNVLDLNKLFEGPRSKLSSFWWKHILPAGVGVPVIQQIGNNLGANSLASSMQFLDFDSSIDLSKATLQSDLERLVLGALVYTRELVRSTTMTTEEQRGNYVNEALVNSTDGHVPDEYADFVISSPEVTTMSVWVLIVTPAICLFIWTFIALKATFLFTEHWGSIRNDSWRGRYVQRTILFSAVQLYRLLDEEVSGERRWKGRLSFYPYVSDVSQKYMRRFSEFEVVPTSARKSSPSPSPSPSPPPQTYDATSKSGTHAEIRPVPAYDLSPGAEDGRGGAGDSMRPLVTPFVRPAFVPLHERRSSAPIYAAGAGGKSEGGKAAFSADRRRPISEYAPSADKYELVMTRHWRPSLNESDMIHWRQVQNE
ncbi:hypothetical protein BZA05DRAFT_34714 [Tricharina praecox]|uniref:uncharacterized protein n=1 Tax=Tricharina praecox TaxID=43433 RepID=UPI002220A680|nr:uncharacterized protein BZA05DRAFT_34714 [Tricharina praecox]KAI5852081.1 hypothetical protein BZA05DRAFT_34714 [Tricharina praecox]